ncbi:MAG: HTTM domain-containing protein [Polyangiaceae bacterium]
MVAFSGYALFQVLFPFRCRTSTGDVRWHEQGCAGRGASWSVREKNASVTYRVTNPVTGKVFEVPPRRY